MAKKQVAALVSSALWGDKQTAPGQRWLGALHKGFEGRPRKPKALEVAQDNTEINGGQKPQRVKRAGRDEDIKFASFQRGAQYLHHFSGGVH